MTQVAEARKTGGRRKESLEEILRRRSGPPAAQEAQRAAAVQFSLEALTRSPQGTLLDVPLDDLHPNPFQPRFQFQRQPLEELAQSLASEGQLEPIIARRVRRDGREVLEIVAGARRLEAARICNASIRPFPTLRADVRELTDEDAERISLIENLQRENLTPLEEGYRYWQLQRRDPRKWSVRAIAEFVHKKKSTVQNRLGLVKDPLVAEAVLREQLPPTAGFHILRLPPPERHAYLRSAIAHRLTVEQIKGDVDRRLALRQATTLAAGQGEAVPGDTTDTPPGAGTGSPAGAAEAAPGQPVHPRALQGPLRYEGPPSAERRAALEAQQTALLARMEALELELHRVAAQLREVERSLALLDASPLSP
ncbi:MAG TPA: ParB/RepB/Spo0J family partition protein [Chloroflexota bacterium]|nr:ParB/RepB/Spo0J family partition protein [Chloroflexota bacterium]